HALWTLDGSKALDRGTVFTALEDRDHRVAAAAVRPAERFPDDRELGSRVAAMVRSRSEPSLRLQLALTLGTLRNDEALRALAVAAGDQPFLADALVSGLAGREAAFLEALARDEAAAAHAGNV